MSNKKLFFQILFLINFLSFFTFTFAATQNSTQDSTTVAQAICNEYMSHKNVFDDPTLGGGSSVPVDLSQLKDVLLNIQKNTGLTGSELRIQNIINFCKTTARFSEGIKAITQAAAKSVKTIADECQTDINCAATRMEDKLIQQKVKARQQQDDVGKKAGELLVSTYQEGKKPAKEDTVISADQIQKCVKEADQNNLSFECMATIRYWSPENRIIDKYTKDRSDIDSSLVGLIDEYKTFGVLGTRSCARTESGADPATVKWSDPDCNDVRNASPVINQEEIRKIVDLPYDQALSSSGIFGADQSLSNINTRVQQGNLIDGDVGNNFGSASGRDNSTGVGTGNPGGPTGKPGNLKDAEASYKKLISNIAVITNLYDVVKAAYASSTYVCKKLSVTTRSATISQINGKQKPIQDYKTDLMGKWDKASSTPNENHQDLILQITFDLRDRYNQELIDKVLQAVKDLLLVCKNAT